jgi:hypothetical protein
LCRPRHWVLSVHYPHRWIVPYIPSNSRQFVLIPYDTLLIVPLPERFALDLPQFINLARREGFERADNFRQSMLLLRRGGFQTRPIIKKQNSMNVIRHNDEFINCDVIVVTRQVFPDRPYHSSGIIQFDLAIGNITENALSAFSTNRHKIPASLRIVVIRQPDGTSLTFHETWIRIKSCSAGYAIISLRRMTFKSGRV